ncbi:hypothetical protein CH296_00350 [Rhodococcus sp. 14-2496-1d]|uniref:peptidoglycan recognition protein family protein n=1 Tax=Rhodococcus sp. 14-2496-1d TaxID=2023146 RepID=UPI000B9B188E|nr:N-acetylmuramoyl-L-alanine amidase [Rhodococcus sp. 14-2496-1d]OZF40742.1 hypothetical protein CH296_00350 [Rhodococcus sp. 14-2496-1d]
MYTDQQLAYARIIVAEGVRQGITKRGQIIGLATSLVECRLRMLANRADPETLNYPHEGLGKDSKSSGLFQQQPPWWGTVAERMNPTASARMFFEALARLDYNGPRSAGWYAQQVQRSDYPERYDEHMAEASALYDLLATPTQEGAVLVPENPITRTQLSPNRHSGGRDVDWLAIHTQQARSSAANLANFLGNSANQVSYNAIADERETVLIVPYDQNPWAASNANSRADHFCFAGSFAEWTREQWLDPGKDADGVNQDLMMWRGAAWLAERSIARDIPLVYVGKAGVDAGIRGVVGHVDFGAWGGGHTDPGPNFPWDVLIDRARAIVAGQPLTKGFLMALSDEEQKRVLDAADRVNGVVRSRVAPEGVEVDPANFPHGGAAVLDALDGAFIVEKLGNLQRTLDGLPAAIAAAIKDGK